MSSLLSSAYSWLTVGPPQVAALAVVGMVMWRRNWSSLLGVLLCLATVSGGLVTFAGGAALVHPQPRCQTSLRPTEPAA